MLLLILASNTRDLDYPRPLCRRSSRHGIGSLANGVCPCIVFLGLLYVLNFRESGSRYLVPFTNQVRELPKWSIFSRAQTFTIHHLKHITMDAPPVKNWTNGRNARTTTRRL